MARLRFSKHAEDSLRGIWLGIAADNPRAADRIVDRIQAACRHLRDHPHLGRAHPEIAAGARVLVVDRWLILYEVVDSDVVVRSVVDGRRERTELGRSFEGRDGDRG